MTTRARRLRALVLAALIAITAASLPIGCTGPSEGPKPTGGVPSY